MIVNNLEKEGYFEALVRDYPEDFPTIKDAKKMYMNASAYLNSPEEAVDGTVKHTAEAMGVSRRTVQRLKNESPELSDLLVSKEIINPGRFEISDYVTLSRIASVKDAIEGFRCDPSVERKVSEIYRKTDPYTIPGWRDIDERLYSQKIVPLEAMRERKALEDRMKSDIMKGIFLQEIKALPAQTSLLCQIVYDHLDGRKEGWKEYEKSYLRMAKEAYSVEMLPKAIGLSATYLPKKLRTI